jgi:hypothetical protein
MRFSEGRRYYRVGSEEVLPSKASSVRHYRSASRAAGPARCRTESTRYITDNGDAMITSCPACYRLLEVPDGTIGHRVRCPACRMIFVNPDPQGQDEEIIIGVVRDARSQHAPSRWG